MHSASYYYAMLKKLTSNMIKIIRKNTPRAATEYKLFNILKKTKRY